ncbi:uncharacterized protein LOC128231569 [Mya arenaria]|uniref:uncharacterized protein LOC128231569 n=1 Tax=Mya arenaria TaxID=6604 RepID=UPI0022E84A81|nr:uncharacterized protein LOC128231569 [Mya arenaria]
MMKTDDSEEEYLLVGKTSLEELLAPIKRSARLRYNCISVSQRLVALGSNTGGIYVFSRLDKKLLQIAFADKETNSVSIVKFSPHGKFVAFASGSSVHVLDLKLETRSKAETLRSSSDLGVAMATYLHWDETNSKLYVGDDSGGIHLMTVHTNKAKNLFSLPLEVIMKLDSGVVQIDSVDDRLLVSTLTRCYLCNTKQHTYTQIGKKLRDGSYGSCFLHVGDSTMIYSARPGSRVWEVDYEGAVLNTHQFRQLLAIPPSPVLNLLRALPSSAGLSAAQSVSFPKLLVLHPNLLLTWTTSSIYVLDPINVKVILWCNQFSGIVDVACVGQELFVFLQTMEVQCVSFLPVTVVIPLYMRLSNVETAADLCLRHREIFMHKHVRKRFATADLLKICNQLVGIELNEKAEKIHELIKEIEQKTVVDVDLESSESSGKICSASLFSDIQEIVVEPQNQRNNDTHNQVQHKATKHTSANNKDEIEIQSSNLKENTNFGRNLDVGIKLDSIIEGTDTVGNGQHATSVNGFYNTYNTTGSDHILGESNEEMQGSTHTPNVVEDESAYEIQEMTQQTNVLNEESVDVFDMMGEMNNLPLDDTTGYTQSNSDCEENKLTSISQTDSPRILVNSAALVAENDSSNVREEYPIEQDSKTLNITDCNIETEITAEAKQMAEDEMFMENDVLGLLPAKVLLPRRSSLTSLSSMSSAEVMFDQPTTLEEGDEDQIAVPVRRKTGRKKKRRSVGDVVTRQGRRHSSAGSLQADTASPRDGSLAMLDDGSSPSVSGLIGGEEDSISLYSNNSVNLEDGVCTHALARDTPDSASLDQTIDTLSLGSPMSASGDHGYSGEFGRSDEFLQSGESYTGESKQRGATLTSAAPKAAFKQFKDKVQNKMSTKTKTLIKNIKDKNLLTKAKEFAENLSQGSENYLNSIEGMITELPSGRNNNDVEASLSEETYSSTEVDGVSTFDETDSAPKSVVDLKTLEKATQNTKEKLNNVDILTNSELLYNTLFDWVTVLNETIHEMHLIKYGSQSRPHILSVLENNNEKLKSSTGKPKDSNSANSIGESTVSTECALTLCGTSPENSTVMVTVLQDKDFCYVKDPLLLPRLLFKDVCELAQACFDIGCHGNIMKFHKNTSGKSSFSQGHDKMPVCDTDCGASNGEESCSCSNTGINGDAKETVIGCAERELTSTSVVTNCDKSASHIRDDMSKTFMNTFQTVTVCDKVEQTQHEHIEQNGNTQEKEKILNMQSSENDVNQGHNNMLPKCADTIENVNTAMCTTSEHFKNIQTVICAASVPEERPSSVEVGKEVQDKEMGFFLRCYFPYMQVGKVRADVLSGRAGYHTWTAIITCMEVLAAYDSERYGVEQRSIIGHLLENQAHLDHGAALVGHVARLFRSRSPDIGEVCMRCSPHVTPMDVLYLSRLHNVSMDTTFKPYVMWLSYDSSASVREAVFAGLHKHMSLLLSWLEMLLSDGLNEADTRTMQGQSRVMSHQLQWKHGGQLAKLTQCVELTSVPDVLDLFYKYRYWVGVLKLLKMSGRHRDHLTLVLQLRDRKLISGTSEIGYMPHSAEEWKELLLLYKSICVDQSEDATDSDLLTWSSLAILLVRYVGPEGAVSLLEECQVPDGVLSPEFFQTCLLSGLVNNYQRKVLHAMLEKVDSYLWSQRPTAVTPQVHFLAVTERSISGETSQQQQRTQAQALGGYLCSEGDPAYQTEDPECHWGIKTRINKVCLCCNISLMEAVSHDDPGVLIFKCGHGFHKLCVPGRLCPLCHDLGLQQECEPVC